eukprot:GDKJ01018510.1.p1 GENE.GDKJ01018510.1~~GDKJ01018510.1.p1  ORF type:complete len:224 (+),score=39.36 GDKJ01018510.1:30-701(+)
MLFRDFLVLCLSGALAQTRLRGDKGGCETGKDCDLSRRSQVFNVLDKLKSEKSEREVATFMVDLIDTMAIADAPILALQPPEFRRQIFFESQAQNIRRLREKDHDFDNVCSETCGGKSVCRVYDSEASKTFCLDPPEVCKNYPEFEVWLLVAYKENPTCASIAGFGPHRITCGLRVGDWFQATIRKTNPSIRFVDGHMAAFENKLVAEMCPLSCGVCSDNTRI